MRYSRFFNYKNAHTKKEEPTMELSLTLRTEWMLQNLIPPMLCSQIPLLDACSTMEQVQC
jgi:hypothetical protein